MIPVVPVELDAWELEQLTGLADWRSRTAASILGTAGELNEARAARERDAQRWRELLAKLKRAGG